MLASSCFSTGRCCRSLFRRRCVMWSAACISAAKGRREGLLFDLTEYPGAVFNKASDKRVCGAVFRMPEDSQVLEALDRYEGYEPAVADASLFVRKLQAGGTLNAGPTNTMGIRRAPRSLQTALS